MLVLVIAAAMLAGIAAGALPPWATVALIVVAWAALGIGMMRGAFKGRGPSPEQRADPPSRPDDDAYLRLARLCFYAGSATVTFTIVRPAFGLTLSAFFFLGSLGACVLSVVRGRGVAPLPGALVAAVFTFALGGGISSVHAASPGESTSELIQAVYVMTLWSWAGAMALRTRAQFMTALAFWVVSAAVNGAGALAQVAGLDALVPSLNGARATGFTDHPNDLGGTTGIALLPALLLASRSSLERGFMLALGRWVAVGLIAAGVLLSASVSGMAGALVGVIFWLACTAVRPLARVAVIAAVPLVLLMLVGFAGDKINSPTERVERVTAAPGAQAGSGSGQDRIEIIRESWPEIVESPIVGRGLDAEGSVVSFFHGDQLVNYQAHGAPVAAWYEAGLFGVIGILMVFATLFLLGWRALVAARDDEELAIGWSVLAAFASFFVFALSAPFVFQHYGWFSAVMLFTWWSLLAVRRGERQVASIPVIRASTGPARA